MNQTYTDTLPIVEPRNSPLVACHTYIPQNYNDGTPINETDLRVVRNLACNMFGGCTLGPIAEGSWRETPDAAVQTEDVRRLDVACSDRRQWDAFLRAVCEMLDQVCVYNAWGVLVTFTEHS